LLTVSLSFEPIFFSCHSSDRDSQEAAAKLIQKLDLCPVEENSDEEQEVVEKFAVDKTFNPTIQYFNQVVTHKAVNPE